MPHQNYSHVHRISPAVLWLSTALLAGCASPMVARYPATWTGHPRAEAAAYQQQDPFPDPNIGPDTGSRPRDYAQPRAEARQAAEQRLFQGLPTGPESMRPGYPRSSAQLRGAVY